MVYVFCFYFYFTVCVATITEFADTLTDDVKSDPKQIEEAFKEYCKTAKSKQQRLVGILNDGDNWTETILWNWVSTVCFFFCYFSFVLNVDVSIVKLFLN